MWLYYEVDPYDKFTYIDQGCFTGTGTMVMVLVKQFGRVLDKSTDVIL